MRHVKLSGLCLVIALTVSAIAAVAASAAPVFEISGETETDRFSSKGGALKLETTKAEEVKCESMTATGEIQVIGGSHNVTGFSPTFKGCTSSILGKTYECTSAGEAKGVIKGFDLLGRLGYINKAENKVGILFSPEEGIAGNPNNLFAEFTCSKTGSPSIGIAVRGSIIGSVTPVEKSVGPTESTKAFEVKFTKGASKGEPGVKDFEGEAENKLETETSITEKEGKGFVGSAFEGSNELFPEVNTTIANPWFRITPNNNYRDLTVAGEKVKFTIKNEFGGNNQEMVELNVKRSNFTYETAVATACSTMKYAVMATCSFEATYQGGRGFIIVAAEGPMGESAPAVVVGK